MRALLCLCAVSACGGAATRVAHEPAPREPDRAPAEAPVRAPPRVMEIEWRATQKSKTRVEISIVVDGTVTLIGTLPAPPKSCELISGTEVETRFACRRTAVYNGYVATIIGSEIVVELESFVDRGHGSRDKKVTEVKRLPATGTQLTVAAFTP